MPAFGRPLQVGRYTGMRLAPDNALTVGIVLALLSAIAAGGGDFFGGIAAKRQSALAVTVTGHAAGVVVLALLVHRLPAWHDQWAAVVAGVSVAIGLLFLYRGLAIGKMGVVSPVSATGAALIPIAAGVFFGQRIAAPQVVGIAFCLFGMALLGIHSMLREHSRTGLAHAAIAGVFFGVYLVAISQVNDMLSGLLVAKATALFGLAIATLLRRERIDFRPQSGALAVWAGVLDALSGVAYVFASHVAALAIAATVSTMYPIVTTVMAAIILRERLSLVEQFAAGAAIAGIALIAY
jgi:drug/metabolite transporter (DMT)-like permease